MVLSLLKKSKLLKSIYKRYKKFSNFIIYRFNPIKTLYLNFKFLKFREAIHLPIYVYGSLKVVNSTGSIKINSKIKPGLIKLGYNSDCFSASKGSALLNLSGEIIFNGYFLSSVDYTLDVQGTLNIGNCCTLGNSSKIRCWKSIVLGDFSRIALECQVFDTNFHYVKNIETGEVKNNNTPIKIGKFCWIGNRTSIMKGTILPDYTIVGGNSLVNKDFSHSPDFPMIAGSPAKLISNGFARIYDMDKELYFKNIFLSSNVNVINDKPGISDESIFVQQFFESL